MTQKTKIGWTDYSSNPIIPLQRGWGCTKVSPGCDHCYSETLNLKWGNRREYQGQWQFLLKDKELNDLKKVLSKEHKPQKVFICDMTDLFHPDVPFNMTLQLFDHLEQLKPHIFQVLTKRPKTMLYFSREHLGSRWPENIWAGASVESQDYANRLDALVRVPARVRFVSAEPLLSALDLRRWLPDLQWIIDGGESGNKRRAAKSDWFRALGDQCQEYGVPYFHKQGNAFRSGEDRQLDGVTWEQMPALDRSSETNALSPKTGMSA